MKFRYLGLSVSLLTVCIKHLLPFMFFLRAVITENSHLSCSFFPIPHADKDICIREASCGEQYQWHFLTENTVRATTREFCCSKFINNFDYIFNFLWKSFANTSFRSHTPCQFQWLRNKCTVYWKCMMFRGSNRLFSCSFFCYNNC